MAMDIDIVGGTSGNKAEVAGTNQLKVILETNATTSAANIGGVRMYSENDQGLASPNGVGVPYLQSPETDDDYRLRVGLDTILDEEQITYSTQNFTKHRNDVTTFVPAWTTNGYSTNPTSLTTAAATDVLRTWKTCSVQGTETLSLDMEISFTFATGSALASPQVIEAGFGLLATSTPFDCFDGVYFRLTSAGMYLVMRNNNTSDSAVIGPLLAPDGTGVNNWQPVSGRKYQIILYVLDRDAELWINDPVLNTVWLAGDMNVPAGLGTPTASPNLQVFLRHYQSTAPAVAATATLSRYSVRRGGGQPIAANLGDIAQRTIESNLMPGTLTTTGNQTVTTGSIAPAAAAVPTNTTSLLASLSGIVLETATLAAATDAILMSYQNPALPTTTGTSYPQARRLRIEGVAISSVVSSALVGGGIAKQFYLAYGSTSLSLAGVASDTVTTKAYRRVQLPIAQAYAATAAAGTLPSGDYSKYVQFTRPIYVNPGEFVALVERVTVGTAVTAGTIQHAIAFDYAWE